MTRKIDGICTGIVLLSLVGGLWAAGRTWTGQGTAGDPPEPDPNWNNNGNWAGGVIPEDGDDVIVADATPQELSVADVSGLVLASLYLADGMTLQLVVSLVVGDPPTIRGALRIEDTVGVKAGSNHYLQADYIRVGGRGSGATLIAENDGTPYVISINADGT